MKYRALLRSLVSPAIVLGFALGSHSARAAMTIGGDLDYADPIDSSAGAGWGFGVRLGQELHVPAVVLNPEIGFNYDAFSSDPTPTVYRGIFGLRLGVGEVLRPGLYGHVGIARIDFDRAPDFSHTAFTYDVGAFLEFTALPLLNIGVHAAYNAVASGGAADTFKWISLGAHATLVF